MANSESWTEVAEKMVCYSPESTADLTVYLEEWEVNPVCQWGKLHVARQGHCRAFDVGIFIYMSMWRQHLSQWGKSSSALALAGILLYKRKDCASLPTFWPPGKPNLESITLWFSPTLGVQWEQLNGPWRGAGSFPQRPGYITVCVILIIHLIQQSEGKDVPHFSTPNQFVSLRRHEWHTSVVPERQARVWQSQSTR